MEMRKLYKDMECTLPATCPLRGECDTGCAWAKRHLCIKDGETTYHWSCTVLDHDAPWLWTEERC